MNTRAFTRGSAFSLLVHTKQPAPTPLFPKKSGTSLNLATQRRSENASAGTASGLRGTHGLHFTVLDAVSEIDPQADDQPDYQHLPGEERQLAHEIERATDAKDGNQRNQRRAERTLHVGVTPAQNPDTGTNNGKGEQRSHVDQSCKLIDGQQCGKKRNNRAYDDVRYPGGAEFGMNGRSPFP